MVQGIWLDFRLPSVMIMWQCMQYFATARQADSGEK